MAALLGVLTLGTLQGVIIGVGLSLLLLSALRERIRELTVGADPAVTNVVIDMVTVSITDIEGRRCSLPSRCHLARRGWFLIWVLGVKVLTAFA